MRAAHGLSGSWASLNAWLLGDFALEKDYLLSKGVREEGIRILGSADELGETAGTECPHLLMLHFPSGAFSGSYAGYIGLLRRLKALSAGRPRVLVLETGPLGLKEEPAAPGEDETLKGIYLEILKSLEEKMGKEDFVAFHEEMLAEADENEAHPRLVCMAANEKVKALLKKDSEIKGLFGRALKRVMLEAQAGGSFESGFVVGPEEEQEKLLKILSPGRGMRDFLDSAGGCAQESLLGVPELKPLLHKDAAEPLRLTKLWKELEAQAGRFLDLSCGKAFNKLSREEKYDLSKDERFEKKAEPETFKPDILSSFNRFALDEKPPAFLGGVFGKAAPGGFSGSAAFPPKAELGHEDKVDLSGYGENFLAMLASFVRGRVYTGGAMFEYAYAAPEGRCVLGSVVMLNEDAELLRFCEKAAEALSLPGSKSARPRSAAHGPLEAAKAFFSFNKEYTRFYERMKSQIKVSEQFFIGAIGPEDYKVPEREPEAARESSDESRQSKREKERLAAQLQRSQHQSRIEAIRESRKQRRAEAAPAPEPAQDSPEQEAQEKAAGEPQADVGSSKHRDDIELKRMELEHRIEEEKKRKHEHEESRRLLREEQDRRRRELDEQRRRRKDQEKLERQMRMDKLAEEKRKREEVRQRRIASLKDAFQKAQETAQKKQEEKQLAKAEKGKGKRKKEINPDAVKMMIRFGDNDETISGRTGMALEAVAQLRQEVMLEDGKTK